MRSMNLHVSYTLGKFIFPTKTPTHQTPVVFDSLFIFFGWDINLSKDPFISYDPFNPNKENFTFEAGDINKTIFSLFRFQLDPWELQY